MASERRVAGLITSLVYDRGLHESLLVPVLMYSSETMKWEEKERSERFSGYQENG